MSERGVADHRAREDRISFLPDHLLCEILSDLPTEMAVRTIVLSKRWKSLWLSVPLLDLHINEFPDEDSFVGFVHGFLHVSKESCLLKLKLAFNSGDGHMTQWIDYAVLRKVQHLDIERRRFGFSLPEPIMPLSFYTCETLLHLKLNSVMLSGFEHASLPRLKILHLIDNIYTNDAIIEKLISSCPLLEDLTVVGNGSEDVGYVVKVLRVRSRSLKTLVISLSADKYYWDSEDDDPDPQVVIDAPGLNFLSLKDDEQLRSFVINNLSSSAKVDIDVNFGLPHSKTSVVRKFFTMLSSVRDMTIRGTTMKIRCLCLRYEPLPQFPYMIRFHGVFCNSDLKELPNFLDICPNLESLVLELEEFKKNELLVFSSSSVPECLRTSLEYVEMKTPISGARAEMKLIKYFLENSAVLKKFKLRLGCRRMNQESIIFMELLRLKRCSASCEVVVELEEASSISQKFL